MEGANASSSSVDSSNHLYIKSVSPLATEQSVKDFFRQALLEAADGSSETSSTVADDIVSVFFLPYPQSSQKYCRLDFKSSSGITSAISLTGQYLHGVPTDFSVIDPSLASRPELREEAPSSYPTRLPANALALQQALNPETVHDLFSEATNHSGGVMSNPQVQALHSMLTSTAGLSLEQANLLIQNIAAAVQIAKAADLNRTVAQASIVTAINKAQSGFGNQNFMSTINMANNYSRETEAQQIARTLFVADIPDQWDLNILLSIVRDYLGLGTVTDARLDRLPSDNSRFALVEFASAEAVEVASGLSKELRTVEVMQPGVTLPDRNAADFEELSAALNGSITLRFEAAKTTVRPREPDNVCFTLKPNQASVIPIAYQSLSKLNLEDKLARVRAMAKKIEAAKGKTNLIEPVAETEDKGGDDDDEQQLDRRGRNDGERNDGNRDEGERHHEGHKHDGFREERGRTEEGRKEEDSSRSSSVDRRKRSVNASDYYRRTRRRREGDTWWNRRTDYHNPGGEDKDYDYRRIYRGGGSNRTYNRSYGDDSERYLSRTKYHHRDGGYYGYDRGYDKYSGAYGDKHNHRDRYDARDRNGHEDKGGNYSRRSGRYRDDDDEGDEKPKKSATDQDYIFSDRNIARLKGKGRATAPTDEEGSPPSAELSRCGSHQRSKDAPAGERRAAVDHGAESDPREDDEDQEVQRKVERRLKESERALRDSSRSRRDHDSEERHRRRSDKDPDRIVEKGSDRLEKVADRRQRLSSGRDTVSDKTRSRRSRDEVERGASVSRRSQVALSRERDTDLHRESKSDKYREKSGRERDEEKASRRRDRLEQEEGGRYRESDRDSQWQRDRKRERDVDRRRDGGEGELYRHRDKDGDRHREKDLEHQVRERDVDRYSVKDKDVERRRDKDGNGYRSREREEERFRESDKHKEREGELRQYQREREGGGYSRRDRDADNYRRMREDESYHRGRRDGGEVYGRERDGGSAAAVAEDKEYSYRKDAAAYSRKWRGREEDRSTVVEEESRQTRKRHVHEEDDERIASASHQNGLRS